MDRIYRAFPSIRHISVTKFIARIFLLTATIALAAIVISQSFPSESSNDLKRNSQKNLKAVQEDLTIVSALEQSKGKDGENDDVIVRIPRQGRVKGTTLQSREGRTYFAFYQIPYAASPIGPLRFKLPETPKRWSGVRDATQIGVECLQKEKYAPIVITAGDESCLHLNVYTPVLPRRWRKNRNLPVLFYIHGGHPYAKYFMDEDVVLITSEFRLGAFATFTTGTESYPGNIDFKDQAFALKWVQKNIQRFGGDPQNVMIFGNSGGATSVNAHLLSPMSKGLFHRAILESGAVSMGVPNDSIEHSKQLATEVGCGQSLNGTEEDLVGCLQKVDANIIVLSSASLNQQPFGYVDNWEGLTSGRKLERTVFTPEISWKLLHRADPPINKVPLIVGVNSQEFIGGALSEYLTTENGTRYINEFWNDIFPPFAGIKDDENHTIAEEFRQFYFGDEEIGNDTRVRLFDLQSNHAVHGIRLASLLYANHSDSPVYFYWMPKEGPKSYGDRYHQIFPPPYGTAHADELQYLFLYSDYPEIPVGSPWFPISKIMVQLWVSFAKDGKPQPKATEWPPIDLKDKGTIFFQLDDELKVVEPFTDAMMLWDKYIDNMYSASINS